MPRSASTSSAPPVRVRSPTCWLALLGVAAGALSIGRALIAEAPSGSSASAGSASATTGRDGVDVLASARRDARALRAAPPVLRDRRGVAPPPVVITGIVLDRDGVPATGVAVGFEPGSELADLLEPGGTATTDDDGRFALPLAVAHGGNACGALLARRGEEVGTGARCVGTGTRPDDVELRLGPALALGGVARVGGAPAAGVRIRARRVGGHADEFESPVGIARSGPDGRFRLAGFGPGVYRLAADLGAVASTDPRFVQVLAGAAVPDVAIDLPAAREIALLVEGRDGRGVAGVRVRSDDDELLAVTDGAGTARFLAAADGEPTYVQLETPGDGRQHATVTSGVTTVVLDPTVAVGGEIAADYLGVVDVVARSLEPGGGAPSVRLRRPGRFALALPPGRFEIVAEVAGVGRAAPVAIEVGDRPLELGTIAVAGQVGALDVVVRDGDGEPAPGAWFSLSREGGGGDGLAATADDGGRITLDRVPVGRYTAHADVDGEPIEVALEMSTGAPLELEVMPAYAAEPDAPVDDADDDVVPPAAEPLGDEADDAPAALDDDPIAGLDDEGEGGYYQPAFGYARSTDGLVVFGAVAGLLPGDVITAIDGRPATEADLAGARGPVRLHVLRPATGEHLDVTVERDTEVEEEGC